MEAKHGAEKHMPLVERHKHRRLTLELSGKLSVPAEEEMIECFVLNLCSSGAGVICEKPAPLQTYAVLDVDGFGSFECVTSRHVKKHLDLRFIGKEARRKRILGDIANFVDEGVKLRWRRNRPSISEIRFTRPNGEQFRSGIEKISSEGAWLRTSIRPPLGEIVYFGHMCGRVVQHHSAGIAIRFLQIEHGPGLAALA
jgi:hypothetical protein